LIVKNKIFSIFYLASQDIQYTAYSLKGIKLGEVSSKKATHNFAFFKIKNNE